MTVPHHAAAPPAVASRLVLPAAVGIAVSVGLGVYGRVHEPTGVAVNVAGFSSTQTVKVWLVTLAALLALVQLVTALFMYDRLPGIGFPSWSGAVHRWSGRAAFLITIPVAVHCLYALGFADYDTRTLVHSLSGCFFYGAFVVKMLVLPRSGTPAWSLPLLGGLVFTALTALWWSSALWFFTTVGFKL